MTTTLELFRPARSRSPQYYSALPRETPVFLNKHHQRSAGLTSQSSPIGIEIGNHPRITVAMSAQAQEELMSSLKILFTESVWSDLMINCGNDTYNVHKALVCPRSAFFKNACSVGRFKEGKRDVIELPEDDPVAVKMMVYYLYHLDYLHQPKERGLLQFGSTPVQQESDVKGPGLTPAVASWLTSEPGLTPSTARGPSTPLSFSPTSMFASNSSKSVVFGSSSALQSPNSLRMSTPPTDVLGCSNLTIHAKVYALAEKYGIPSLKVAALDKFKHEAKYFWLTNDFLLAAEEVYTSTVGQNRGLRDIVVETIHQHPMMMDSKSTQDAVKGNPDLSFDMLMHIIKQKGPSE